MHIVNIGYDSTNYYVLGQHAPRLLIDVGMPGTLPKLLANLKRKDIALRDVQYLLVTHYHPDHAGIAQDVKAQGVRLVVFEPQLEAIPLLKTFVKPTAPYVDITLHDNLVMPIDESRRFLKSIGVEGSIISTPGHSEDSVTLVLDEGAAFTGDLPPPLGDTPDFAIINESWNAIRSLNATLVYPGHGPIVPVPPVMQ